MTKLHRVLSIVLGLIILGAVALLIYVLVFLEPGEAYTEFYILGPGGQASGYPEQLRAGEEGEVRLGIVSRERETMAYLVEIRVAGITQSELGPVVLEHEERFENLVGFTFGEPGEGQKVEFLLYKEGQSEVYQALYLWVDVEE